MSSIDTRIVEMKFDNKDFERGSKETRSSLAALKEALKLDGAKAGIDEVQKTASKFSLRGMAEAVDSISSKFSLLGAIGFTVIQNLTNKALSFGARAVNSLLGPILEGGAKRALNIEQARFQFKGMGIDVEKAMSAANEAVLGTAYGLDEAARAASQFGASGMKAGPEMTKALRSIAGVAAMTGSSYEDISRIFTSVAGNGRVMGNDLLQLSGRGLNVAATLAKAMGKTEGEVRKMVSQGKIDFETFYKAMDDAFGKHATSASDMFSGAASNFRASLARIGQGFQAIKFESFRQILNAATPVINKFNKALAPALQGYRELMELGTKKAVNFLENLDITKFKVALPQLVRSVRNIGHGLMTVVRPIKEAFKEVFPPSSVKQVRDFFYHIAAFTTKLRLSQESMENLKRTARGFFSIFGIGLEIVKQLARGIFELAGHLFSGSAGFLGFTGNIGDFIFKMYEAIKAGDGLGDTFDAIIDAGKMAIDAVKGFAGGLKDFVKALLGIGGASLDGLGDRLKQRFHPLVALGGSLGSVWQRTADIFTKVGDFLKPILEPMVSGVKKFFSRLRKELSEGDFKGFWDLFNAGLLTGLALTIKKFIDKLGGIADSGSGVLESFQSIFDGVTDTLEAMQSQLKAKTLLSIAGAIALLTASVVALSLIDSEKLSKALLAITVMLGQMMGTLALFSKIVTPGSAAKLPLAAAGLLVLSAAIVVLSKAVKDLSDLDWNELARGLTGLASILGMIVLASKGMDKHSGRLIRAGLGMIALGAAIKILTSAVKDFSELSWEDIGKGLTGVGALLLELSLFSRLADVGGTGIRQGLGILVLSGALKVLQGVVEDFSEMSWADLAKGLAGLAGGLGLLAISLRLIPKTSIAQATSLTIVSGALKVLASVFKDMGALSPDDIGKGLLAIGGGLVVLAGGLYLLSGSLAGAGALVVASLGIGSLASAMTSFGGMTPDDIGKGLLALGGGLVVLAGGLFLMSGAIAGAVALTVAAVGLGAISPVLHSLSELSWEEIGKGLVALAGALLILAGGGLILGPVIPVLMGLGIALGLIGAGVGLAGAGLAGIGIGLEAIARAGSAGVDSVKELVRALIELIPEAAVNFGNAIVEMATTIASRASEFTTAGVKLFKSFLEGAREVVPDLVTLATDAVLGMLRRMRDNIGPFVNLGLQTLTNFLNGIKNNLKPAIAVGTDIVIKVIEGLGNAGSKIADASLKTATKFINDLATAIDNNAGPLREAGGKLAKSLIDGLTGGLATKAQNAVSKAQELANKVKWAFNIGWKINSPSRMMIGFGHSLVKGLVMGLERHTPKAVTTAGYLADSVSQSISDGFRDTALDVPVAINTDPVIRPVVDLTDVVRGASELASIFSAPTISAEVSIDHANQVAAMERERDRYFEDRSPQPKEEEPPITFIQNNNSPKALSTVEIYRQTRNQLSMLKRKD